MRRVHDAPGIDASRPVRFSFNGHSYSGFKGDTLASALLANGVDVVSRSLKFHRPRGLLAAGGRKLTRLSPSKGTLCAPRT